MRTRWRGIFTTMRRRVESGRDGRKGMVWMMGKGTSEKEEEKSNIFYKSSTFLIPESIVTNNLRDVSPPNPQRSLTSPSSRG